MNYEQYVFDIIRMMAERDSIPEEPFTDNNDNSDSLTETDH